MAKIVKIKETLAEGLGVKVAWETVPDFKIGSISLNDFMAVHTAAETLEKEYTTRDAELSGLKANRDERADGIRHELEGDSKAIAALI